MKRDQYSVGAPDEDAIRRSVDDKIVIKSAELKKKRKTADKKVKIRVKKEAEPKRVNKQKPPKEPITSSVTKKQVADKYKNMGKISSPNKAPSAFRRSAANWRDDSKATTNTNTEGTGNSILDKLKEYSILQYLCVAMAVVIFITSVATTAVYADYKGELNKQYALARVPRFVEKEQNYSEDEYSEDDFIIDEAAAYIEDETGRELSLVLTSVEKDLKIKLIDDEDTLVKDLEWGVIITDSDGNEETYEDDDMDGIIHLSDMSAGDYTVMIAPSDSLIGYTYPMVGQEVSVKAKVEYKVIANIKEEIKKESEVNVALEDPNGGKGADVETGTALKDTVTWVESTETSQGEEYEEATVDLSRTEHLIAFVDRVKSALSNLAKNTNRVFNRRLVLAEPVMTVEDEVTPTPEAEPTPTPEPTPTTEPEKSQDTGDDSSDSEPDEIVTDIEVKTATIDRASLNLNVGETYGLKITYAPSGAKPKSVEWMSLDKSVAEVSDKGVVKAVKEGTARVGAMINGVFPVYCDVTVKQANKDASVVLSGASNVGVGETVTIEATCSLDGDGITEWKSLDTSKAEVMANGNQVYVKAIAAGSVRIQATALSGVIAYFDMTIADHVEYKDEAQLYDSNKNKLYVYDNSEYRLAKYIDYKSGNFTKFYRKIADIVYTGWQTIDGLTYYYTENHEKVTGDQVIGGVTYHFGSDGALTQGSGTLGIDVSKYQPSINWNSVKASGINYVIIRCGYRGASTGALIQDPCFYSHIKGAKAAGLKVGVYFFSTALNEAEAVEEASMCAALCSGYGINYPVFIDVESSSRPGYNGLSAADRTANIKAFCSTISSAGYTPGVYANKTWLTEKINTSSLSCKIWLAQYNASGPTYTGHYDLWQYTSKGKVDGISGNVDMNQSYLGY